MSPRRIARAEHVTRLATLTSVTVSVVIELATNEVGSLGRWVPLTVIAVGIALWIVLWALRHRIPDSPHEVWRPLPLPEVGDLTGRRHTVDLVEAEAREHGVVVVYGPDGIGTSSVAIEAAKGLVPDPIRQRYVDLSKVQPSSAWRNRIPLLGDSTRWVRMPVLRTFGLDLRMRDDEAAEAVAAQLQGRGFVLLIDNARHADQVRWVARGVPGAYIVIAGDVAVGELPGVADVRVGRLRPEDALRLLCREEAGRAQGWQEPLRSFARWVWRGEHRAPERHRSITDRVNAEMRAARELAEQFLTYPRDAILLRRWLAENPDERISDVLRSFRRGGSANVLQDIMRRSVEGASAEARRLLALLLRAPDFELPDAAVAALQNASPEETARCLDELRTRFIVTRSASGWRLTRRATGLDTRITQRQVTRAHVRLAAYYARQARAHAELLGGKRYEEGARWFADKDVTLLGLLGVPDPERRAASSLWAIADALDLWFARERRHPDRADAAGAMLARAREVGDTTAQAIALIRRAASARARDSISDATRQLDAAERLAHGRAPWRPQLRTERALCHAAAGDLVAAREELVRAGRERPRRDLEGRMTDRINLAVIEIREDRYAAAVDHLREAVTLGRTCGSLGGEAQARELSGVALSGQGQVGLARREWDAAGELYRKAGDAAGAARCGRHRAIEVAPAD